MSIESAKAFIERMNTDTEFAKQAMELEDKEKLATFIKEAGYEFKKEECCEVIEAVYGNKLNDASLDNVVGGNMDCSSFYTSLGDKPAINNWWITFR